MRINKMRKITVAITVDDRMGISFNNRRQSKDKKVVEDIVTSTEGKIYVSNYSAPLFEGFEERIEVVNEPLIDTPDGCACFAELSDLSEYKDEINTLIVYRWNRHYPSERRLGINLDGSDFEMMSSIDFIGSSHDKITKDIFKSSIM